MKKIFLVILILGVTTLCYADRVCIVKATGKLIEYQSGNAPLGTLEANAIRAGYNKADIEEKYVTKQEWEVIKYDQITKKDKEKKDAKKAEIKVKEVEVEQLLNISKPELELLREVINFEE